MGVRIGDITSRFELLDWNDPTKGRVRRRFVNDDETVRFLRQTLVADDTMAEVRQWCFEQGIHHTSGRKFLQLLAAAIASGSVWIGEIEQISNLGKGGGGVKPVPPDPNPNPGPLPGPKPVPKPVAELVVTVKDLNGNLVEGATVTAGSLGSKTTGKDGKADYGKVTPGTYDITAEKPGHGKVKNGPTIKDEKKGVSVPDGSKTAVDLIQHPECANVASFEGPVVTGPESRAKYFGFDPKTNIVAGHAGLLNPTGSYWNPVPAKGSAKPTFKSKFERDGGRWASVAVGQETELEINFDFTDGECVPCIANTTFVVEAASVAEVVTAHVTTRKAAFKIKGLAVGEATLKVKCDGKEIGWFHIWCANEATLKLDVACIITNLAPVTAYSIATLGAHLNDIYRQAAIKIDLFDLGSIDLSADAALATIEANGYPAGGGQFLKKTGTPIPYDSKGLVLNALHAKASAALTARVAAPLPRAGAYRIYWYVPTTGCSILGTVLNIGSPISFGFQPDTPTARNSMAHEFGHSLNLRHPSDPDAATASQFAAHNLLTLGGAVPAYAKTNTEALSIVDTGSGNVLGNDPTNLMGYWDDRPNRKPLRYHQWKAASRS